MLTCDADDDKPMFRARQIEAGRRIADEEPAAFDARMYRPGVRTAEMFRDHQRWLDQFSQTGGGQVFNSMPDPYSSPEMAAESAERGVTPSGGPGGSPSRVESARDAYKRRIGDQWKNPGVPHAPPLAAYGPSANTAPSGGNGSLPSRDAAYEAKRQAMASAWKDPPNRPGGGQQFKSRSQSESAGHQWRLNAL
jgi:hypothetical protein